MGTPQKTKTARSISGKMERHEQTAKKNQSARGITANMYDNYDHSDPWDYMEEWVDANRFSDRFVHRRKPVVNKKLNFDVPEISVLERKINSVSLYSGWYGRELISYDFSKNNEKKIVELFSELPFFEGLYSSEEYDYYYGKYDECEDEYCDCGECNGYEDDYEDYYDGYDPSEAFEQWVDANRHDGPYVPRSVFFR